MKELQMADASGNVVFIC